MKSPNVFFGLAVLLPLLSGGEESAVNNSIYVNQKGNFLWPGRITRCDCIILKACKKRVETVIRYNFQKNLIID